ncbi:unnamed protein product [Staurois parvus]|uniref:G-protein coupled receptors family 1 profile domain-containing protein n=1 Tax=Staurois parvus TaxID=386267 RepID=A0ABN9B0G8_9NEOB|nr:unnamed protein product [Staurois parvus]
MFEILIVGFENLTTYRIPLFLLLLVIYIFTCFENLLVIFLVNKSPHLHFPMYFLISNFHFCQFFYTTNLVPRMLHDLLSGRGVISYLGCITQLNILGGVSNVESFLYVMMSYDRYLAICHPLRYSTLMHNRLCLYIVIGFWLVSSVSVAVVIYFLIHVEFCGSVIINHFHCDFTILMLFACSDIAPYVSYRGGQLCTVCCTFHSCCCIVHLYHHRHPQDKVFHRKKESLLHLQLPPSGLGSIFCHDVYFVRSAEE